RARSAPSPEPQPQVWARAWLAGAQPLRQCRTCSGTGMPRPAPGWCGGASEPTPMVQVDQYSLVFSPSLRRVVADTVELVRKNLILLVVASTFEMRFA